MSFQNPCLTLTAIQQAVYIFSVSENDQNSSTYTKGNKQWFMPFKNPNQRNGKHYSSGNAAETYKSC